MRKLIYRCVRIVVPLIVSASALAATSADFYLGLLRRGATEVDAGRYADAITPLRLAAFGLIESVDAYQTAQVNLAIAFDRLDRPDDARDAAGRVLAAQRVERRYLALQLPTNTRNAFDAIAKKTLTAADVALLNSPAEGLKQTSSSVAEPPKVVPEPPKVVNEPPKVVTETKPPVVNDPPKTVVAEKPKAVEPPKVVEKPKPTPPPAPAPAPTNTTTTTTPPKPQPQPQPARVDVSAQLAAAERALNAANLNDARRIYRDVLSQSNLDRMTLIRVAEGLYRARDFAAALNAFQRVGQLRAGEEPYRYYVAVAFYETGQYDKAKQELAAALPYIEITQDVARYRAKIEGAID